MNKFLITYTDGTTFEGDPFVGDWKKVDDTKQIAKLEYVLGNSCIIMEGFKQYNHFKECVGLQVKGYTKVILMGRTADKSLLIIFDLQKNKIYKVQTPYGEEWGKQILAGWCDGKLTIPQVKFKKLTDKNISKHNR